MKKITKITSTVMAGLMMVSAMPAATASAATVAKPKITAENVNKGVKITWKKAKNAKKYVVMRKLSTAKKYTAIKTVKNGKAGSFVDKKAKAGKTYTYRVTAYNGKATATSKVKTIIRLATPEVVIETFDGSIAVQGNKKTLKGAKTVQVWRATVKNGKTGKYKLVDKLNPKDEWDYFEDVDTTNAIFKFKIRAVNGKSKSAFSKAKKVDFIQPPNGYSTLRNDFQGIDVTWGIIDDVEGFRIYRGENGAKAQLLVDIKLEEAVVDPNAEEYFPSFIYTDTAVEDGVTYAYYLEAYDGKRVSDRTEAFMPVTYEKMEYTVKVGETTDAFANDKALALAELDALMKETESLGATVEVNFSYVSDNTEIFTINEEDIITGVAEGEANVILTVSAEIKMMGITLQSINETVNIPVVVTK